MDRTELAAASRDSLLTLRRVERQQQLIETLVASGRRMTLRELSFDSGVSTRTIARDIERLRSAGVPIVPTVGPAGGVELRGSTRIEPVALDLAEAAALVASLAAVGPTSSPSASSAMTKLVAAMR